MALAKYQRISLEGIGAGWTDDAYIEVDVPDPKQLRKDYPLMVKAVGLSDIQRAQQNISESKLETEVVKFIADITISGKVFIQTTGKPPGSANITLVDLTADHHLDLFHLAGAMIIEVVASPGKQSKG